MDAIPTYTPASHFWTVRENGKVWSSADATYVSESVPAIVTSIASEAELREVLAGAGCPERAPGYVPESCALWKLRTVAKSAGIFDGAQAAVDASGNAALQEAWEYAADIRRDSPSIAALGGALGMSPKLIDALFIASSKLTA